MYVLSDTTEFEFAGEVRGRNLGRIQGRRRGFLGHFAFAVGPNRTPLGVLGIETIVRDEAEKARRNTHEQKRDPDRESLRWGAMVERTETMLEGVEAVHVMDAEGDIFELLSELTARRRRFVIRAGQNRLVLEGGKLFEGAAHSETLLEREVQLSARPESGGRNKGRKRLARTARVASLAISSKLVTIGRPQTSEAHYPKNLSLNLVHVYEPNPPPDQDRVEWVLWTSEPVETVEQVAQVVDGYRTRWLIEEYFKALKTGCAFEERQLRSIRTLTNALGLLAPIAYRLLLLRALERQAPQTPASKVLEPVVLEALAARLKHIGERKPLPSSPTVADIMAAIARLGGHNKSNGPPGWKLLWRGFGDLLLWTSGFIAGRSCPS